MNANAIEGRNERQFRVVPADKLKSVEPRVQLPIVDRLLSAAFLGVGRVRGFREYGVIVAITAHLDLRCRVRAEAKTDGLVT